MRYFFLIGLLVLLLSTCQQKEPAQLTIATAANMQFAMEALVDAFSEEYGITCEIIMSSSGKLTAQIQQGAPFDVFVSADMKYPNQLHENGFTQTPPQIYAYGQLILWTRNEQLRPSIELLQQATFKHLALANPKTAPYGQAAMEVLQYFQLSEKLADQLVYGESIAQTNQFITSGAAELGFTAKSVVLAPKLKNKGNWIPLPTEAYQAIEQGVVLLKSDEKRKTRAQKFYHFLFSASAQEILSNFGYLSPH